MHQDLHYIYAGIRPVIPGRIEEYATLDGGTDDFIPRAREWKFDTFDLRRRDQGPRMYENYSQYMCVGVTNNTSRFIKTMRRIFEELRGIRKMKFPNGKREYMYGHKGHKKTVVPHLQFLSHTLSRLMEKPYFFPAINLEEYQAEYNYGHHGRRRRRIIPIAPFRERIITHARRERGIKAQYSTGTKQSRRHEWSSWDPHTNQLTQGDNHLNTQYSLNRSSSYGHSSSHHAPSYSHSQVARSVSGDSYRHHSPHRESRDYHDYDTRSNNSRDSGYSSRSSSSGSSSRSLDSGYSSRSSNSGRSEHHGGSRAKAAKRHNSRDSAYSSSRYGSSNYGGSEYSRSDYDGTEYSGNSDMDSYLSASSRGRRHNPVYVSPNHQEEIDRLAEKGLVPPNEGDGIPSVPCDEFGEPLPAYMVEERRREIAASSASGGY